jgi:hypothetical protein
MDIFPTILDITGIDYNYKKAHGQYSLHGESLLRLQSPKRDRNYQWLEHGIGSKNEELNRRWIAIRDKKYKYIYFYSGSTEQLFDLENDPGEIINLIGKNNFPEKDYKRLKDKCVEMEQNWGVGEYAKNGNLKKFSRIEYHKSFGSQYPVWANSQFQIFGEQSSHEESDIFVREILEATAHYSNPDFLKELFPDEEWIKAFYEGFKKIEKIR